LGASPSKLLKPFCPSPIGPEGFAEDMDSMPDCALKGTVHKRTASRTAAPADRIHTKIGLQFIYTFLGKFSCSEQKNRQSSGHTNSDLNNGCLVAQLNLNGFISICCEAQRFRRGNNRASSFCHPSIACIPTQ
jgi:hypothetical protein